MTSTEQKPLFQRLFFLIEQSIISKFQMSPISFYERQSFFFVHNKVFITMARKDFNIHGNYMDFEFYFSFMCNVLQGGAANLTALLFLKNIFTTSKVTVCIGYSCEHFMS